MNPIRLLIVEDDHKIAEIQRRFIERHLTREPRAEPLAGTDDEWERRSEKRKRQVE